MQFYIGLFKSHYIVDCELFDVPVFLLNSNIDTCIVMFCLVYTLWQYPQLLPCFTTWPLVLEKLQNGAGKLCSCYVNASLLCIVSF